MILSMKTILGGSVFLLSFAAIAACNDDPMTTPAGSDAGTTIDSGTTPDTCATTGSGTVTVTATGLPAGAAASITFTDASGAHAITDGASITAGTYAVTANAVTTADPRIRTAYLGTVTTSSVCVKDGAATTISVAYAIVPTSNKLWTTNANGTSPLLAFASSTLVDATSPAPAVSAGLDLPNGIAFDRSGGLWTPSSVDGAVKLTHFAATSLADSGTKTPDIALTSAALNAGVPAAASLAFDPSGNLWVSTPAVNKVVRFDAAQLEATGNAEPTASITMQGPGALAFDASGNLWAAELGMNRVVEYTAAHLGAAAPDVILTAKSTTDGDLAGPRGLAFAASGDLWVSYEGVLARFTAAERAATATVKPAVQIGVNVAALPETIAFDESGGLWFAYTAGTLARLSASQLVTSTATGTDASPEIVLSSAAIGSAGEVAIFPAPGNLPLFSRLP